MPVGSASRQKLGLSCHHWAVPDHNLLRFTVAQVPRRWDSRQAGAATSSEPRACMSRPPVTRDFLAKGTASVLSGHSIVNTCAERSNEPVRAKIESDSALPCRSDASLRCSRVSRPPVTRDFLAKGAASVLSGHSIVNTCAERSNEPVRAKIIESDRRFACQGESSEARSTLCRCEHSLNLCTANDDSTAQ